MAIIDRRGKPLPDNHPFKGTRIIFGGTQQTSSGQNSNSAQDDPMLPAMNGLEGAMLQMAAQWRATDELKAFPTTTGSQGSAAADCLDEVGRR